MMIIPAAFPGTRGSPARVYDMSNVLFERGIDVSVACYNEGEGKPTKVPVYRIPRLPFYRNGIGPSYSRIILDFFLMLKVLKVAYSEKIELFHCHLHEGAIIGLLIGKVLNIPVIFDIHSSLEKELLEWRFIKKSGILRKLIIYLDRNIPAWVNYNIALGEKQIQFYKEINDKIKIKRVSNPTDINFFKPAESKLRKQFNLEDKFIIGYQGNLTSLQNLDLLVDAAVSIIAKCSDVIFLIGYTSDPAETKNMIGTKNLDKYFIFIPSPYEATPDIINCCDIMVIPRAETSSLPMKLSNYMACGKPVLLHEELAKGAANDPHLIGLYGFKDKTELINKAMEFADKRWENHKTLNSTLDYVNCEFSYDSLFSKLLRIYTEVMEDRNKK